MLGVQALRAGRLCRSRSDIGRATVDFRSRLLPMSRMAALGIPLLHPDLIGPLPDRRLVGRRTVVGPRRGARSPGLVFGLHGRLLAGVREEFPNRLGRRLFPVVEEMPPPSAGSTPVQAGLDDAVAAAFFSYLREQPSRRKVRICDRLVEAAKAREAFMTLHSRIEHSRTVAVSEDGHRSIASAGQAEIPTLRNADDARISGPDSRDDALFRSWALSARISSPRGAPHTGGGSTFWSWAAGH